MSGAKWELAEDGAFYLEGVLCVTVDYDVPGGVATLWVADGDGWTEHSEHRPDLDHMRTCIEVALWAASDVWNGFR